MASIVTGIDSSFTSIVNITGSIVDLPVTRGSAHITIKLIVCRLVSLEFAVRQLKEHPAVGRDSFKRHTPSTYFSSQSTDA